MRLLPLMFLTFIT